MSAFSVVVRTRRLLDLLTSSLAARQAEWTHPSDYTATQALAAEVRLARMAAIRVPSARRLKGVNVAILDAAALVPPPAAHSSWTFLAVADGLLATQEMSPTAMRFTNQEFQLDTPKGRSSA